MEAFWNTMHQVLPRFIRMWLYSRETSFDRDVQARVHKLLHDHPGDAIAAARARAARPGVRTRELAVLREAERRIRRLNR